MPGVFLISRKFSDLKEHLGGYFSFQLIKKQRNKPLPEAPCMLCSNGGCCVVLNFTAKAHNAFLKCFPICEFLWLLPCPGVRAAGSSSVSLSDLEQL